MPYYSVRLKGTHEVQNLPLMTHEQLQKFLTDHPQYEQVIESPGFVKVKW